MPQQPATPEEHGVTLLHTSILLLLILIQFFPVLLAPVIAEQMGELVQAHLLHVTQVGLVKPIIAGQLVQHLAQALARQVILHLFQVATQVQPLTQTVLLAVLKLVTLTQLFALQELILIQVKVMLQCPALAPADAEHQVELAQHPLMQPIIRVILAIPDTVIPADHAYLVQALVRQVLHL